jgi:hypothetical protein
VRHDETPQQSIGFLRLEFWEKCIQIISIEI